jgi:hypothetical protein
MYYFLYLYKVNHFFNHATHGRIIVVFNRMLQFAESQCANGILLILGIPNRASHIFYSQYSHDILLPGCCQGTYAPTLRSTTAAATTAISATAATTAISATTAAATAAAISTAISTIAPASTAPRIRAIITRFLFASGAGLGCQFSSAGCGESQTLSLSLANDLGNDLATQHGLGFGGTQFQQPAYARLQRIGRVGASQRLGEDVADTDGLNDGAHGPTGDNAGTGSRGFEQHFRGTEAVLHHKGNGCAHQGNLDQVLFRIFDAFTDGFGILSSLAQAKADMTTAISDDHERANAKTATAFDDLRNAAHLHDGLFKIQF